MKWAKSLILQGEDTIAARLLNILIYIRQNYQKLDCLLLSIDATGSFGNKLTQVLNIKDDKKISIDLLILLVNEDGQILEMELSIKAAQNFLIVVRDKVHLDILGDGEELPAEATGAVIDLDKSHYNF